MTAEVIVAPITADEATALCDLVRKCAEDICDVLGTLHERRAWIALGYGTWEKLVAAEFDMSRSRAYQLLNLRSVRRALTEAVSTDVDKPVVRITEAQARDVKPRLAKVTERVREEVAAHPDADPADIVDAVVSEVRAEEEPEDVEDTASDPRESEIGSEDGAGDEIGCLPTESSPPAAIVCSDAEGVLASDISVEWVDGTMSVYVVNAVTEAMWRELEAFCRTQYDETPPARQDFPAWTPPPVNTHGAPPAADLEAVRRTLEAHPNEPLTTTEVAKFAHVSPPRTADALRWLESNEHDVSQKGRCWMLRKVTA